MKQGDLVKHSLRTGLGLGIVIYVKYNENMNCNVCRVHWAIGWKNIIPVTHLINLTKEPDCVNR